MNRDFNFILRLQLSQKVVLKNVGFEIKIIAKIWVEIFFRWTAKLRIQIFLHPIQPA